MASGWGSTKICMQYIKSQIMHFCFGNMYNYLYVHNLEYRHAETLNMKNLIKYFLLIAFWPT